MDPRRPKLANKKRAGEIDEIAEHVLMPTPSTSNRDGNATNNRGELLLPGVAAELLPTPSVAIAEGGQTSRGGDRQGEQLLSGIAESLLPTPVVTDSESARNTTAGRVTSTNDGHQGDTLLDALTLLGLADPGSDLLPTPTTEPNTGNGHARDLASEAVSEGDGDDTADGERVVWGKYRGAILRTQEAARRLAPSPTKADGKGGKRRLAARFVEWMMLLPEGWVTGVPGITRREALKLLGNGVVPDQASAATVILLARVEARLATRAEAGRRAGERGPA